MTKSVVLDESMSILTSASGEVSASSGSRNDTVSAKPHQFSASTNHKPQPKKKRGLQGNPDPDAEVIAFSPKSLLATNRFICEICNKGFQREQNLQLHRRGHNLPWKLKQRTNKEAIRKKVYVCPEPTCAHHDPSRALGDLTGIKKHFSRKHGEKKWRCEKCSKRYAVQSDWKAHSKICGTREYRCDCGTIFSRRDSFITHRAFCDALAQENTRGITAMIPTTVPFHPHLQSHSLQALSSSVKSEPELNSRSHHIPPWLQVCAQVGESHVDNFGLPPMNFSSSLHSTNLNPSLLLNHENPNPNITIPPLLPSLPSSPHMSATSLLQKASQIGVAMSKPLPSFTMLRPHHPHVPQGSTRPPSSSPLGSETGNGFSHGLASYTNQVGSRASVNYIEEGGTADSRPEAASTLQNMMGSLPSASGFGRSSSFEEALSGILNPPRDGNHFNEILSKTMRMHEQSINEMNHINGDGTMISGVYNGNDETTRDFLGLKAVSREPFFSTSAGFHQTVSMSYGQQDQNQASWHQG